MLGLKPLLMLMLLLFQYCVLIPMRELFEANPVEALKLEESTDYHNSD